ncbi:MAG: HEPN domain-containing protein [Vulcanococcus sp.]
MPSECQQEAARMLRLARRDLKAAVSMIDPELFEEASWGFHVQQATEKALKAWISALDKDYPRTHDLALLMRLVMDFGGDPSSYEALTNFSPFGARWRYEDDLESLNLIRQEWNQLCTDLVERVAELIP